MFANPVFIIPGTLHQMKEIQENFGSSSSVGTGGSWISGGGGGRG